MFSFKVKTLQWTEPRKCHSIFHMVHFQWELCHPILNLQGVPSLKICQPLVLCSYDFMPFCFNTRCQFTPLLCSCMLAFTPCVLLQLTPYVWCKYHFWFMPFWFMPSFTGMQLGHETRAGCTGIFKLHNQVTPLCKYLNLKIMTIIIKLKLSINNKGHALTCWLLMEWPRVNSRDNPYRICHR